MRFFSMISFNRRTCGLSVWCVFFLIYQDSKLKVYRLNIHNVDLNINIMFNLVRYYLEPNMKALDKAICIVGGATRLAEKLNVSPMTVSHWRHRDNGFVPAIRVGDHQGMDTAPGDGAGYRGDLHHVRRR
ncbi:YdaS family helix-turn-helix protein [Escherichia coli]|uniref:YdaS family helix-turn-helix protein n=2 Tax=Escherichia coli TaxID=562 RepID=UPI00287B5D81|nr:YdaS family helix-turn-helix protein [Escherichia coli]MDZ9536797.1 YdaS family helix-turn-helix protein [Escherichia coli]